MSADARAHEHTRTQVFVYGTLMRGGIYHHLLAGCRFLRRATTAPRYTLIDLGPYPALLEGGDTTVSGELYEVDGATLAKLDELEGHPNEYRRGRVLLDDGASVTSYIYPLRNARAPAPGIPGGRWIHKHRR